MKTRLALALAILTLGVNAADQAYPLHRNVVVVTQPPYNAKGDGVSDDTEALQRALNENVGRHRVLYFPKGTYLVSATLAWPKKWNGKDNWGKTMLRGQNREQCIIRLKDAVFTDAKKPAAIMWCGGFGSADWFHNYVENLTFDVGAGNPGAVALQFYSNNTGAVRDCRFVAAEGSGHTGLDLAHSGHPVVGDKIYGADETCYLDFIETGWLPALAKRLLLARHALHSCTLTTDEHEWRTGLPPDLAAWSGLPDQS